MVGPAALWAGGGRVSVSHISHFGNFQEPCPRCPGGSSVPLLSTSPLGDGLSTLPSSILSENPVGKSLSPGGSCQSLSCWPISRTVEHWFFCLLLWVEGPWIPAGCPLFFSLPPEASPASPFQTQVPGTDAMLFQGSV